MVDDTQSGEQQDFDGRFNPVFQRGFTGTAERPTPSAYARPSDRAPIPHYVAPVGAPALAEPTVPTAEAASPRAAESEQTVEAIVPDRPPLGPNPWNIALWVLMVVALVAGVLAYKFGLDMQVAGYFGGTDVAAFAYSSMLLGVAPFLLAASLAILIVQLTRLALSWEKNR
jgi:hypothetical protein